MDGWAKNSTLRGSRLQQLRERRLRVADDQPFLFRSPLTFGGFRLGFFGHTVLSSHWFLFGGIPQPGIEPGSPKWARDCKSRPFAISSTGGSVEPNVGADSPSKDAVPTLSGSFSATPKHSSCHVSSREANLAISFGLGWGRRHSSRRRYCGTQNSFLQFAPGSLAFSYAS